MKVSELIERLGEFPDYYDVTVGPLDVTDVLAETKLLRSTGTNGGQSVDPRPVVVIV